jgi:hypothetical protein
MSEHGVAQVRQKAASAGALLQRTCACGQHSAAGGECESCKKKRLGWQRAAINRAAPDIAPPIVHDVLRSPGRPLDDSTRSFMESRFGQNFSRVPIQGAFPNTLSGMRVSQPGDRFEREADYAAHRVMGMANPAPAQSSAASELGRATPGLMRSQTAPVSAPVHVSSPVRAALNLSGKPVEPATRNFMEPRFGHDFSQIRVHTGRQAGESARAVHARAYTVGNHLVFTEDAYQPSTPAGRRLLAHELAHVVQQSGGLSGLSPVLNPFVQRQDDGGLPPGGLPAPGSQTQTQTQPEIQEQPATLAEVRPTERQVVQRIIISCRDMRIRLETNTTAYSYRLRTCSLPVGSYETDVTVERNDFHLDFGSAAGEGEEFYFTYYVEPGQQNPAELLGNQANVHVDVVESLPNPRQPHRATPACALRLDDRVLVRADSLTRQLFEPLEFEKTIWEHAVPLGQFGWVDLSATASGRLSGQLSARYGPGRLSDICLTSLLSRESGSAPIDHWLLGRGSRADVTTYGIGGRARFSLPAQASIRIDGTGALRIAGDYLSVIEVAAAEGVLSAQGEATLAGEINGEVEIIARATQSTATLQAPIIPAEISITNSTIDAVDLSAEIGLRGRAGLAFRLDLSAGFDLLGHNLWRQSWNLAQFNPRVSWRGGLKYSPNPGLHWDLGTLGADDQMDLGPAEDEGLDDSNFHEDSAEVEEEDIIQAILDESQAQVAAPDGLSEDNALPIDWYKPIELYADQINLPNASDPKTVGRDAGPTEVRFPASLVPRQDRDLYGLGDTPSGEVSEDLGVADWPAVDRTFQYLPYDVRRDPEKQRFNRLVDALGFSRSGFDADHVWELNLQGPDADRFDNLWPASNQEQQLAGSLHRIQIRRYEDTLGNVNGRWFVIVRVRHPALYGQ